MRFCIIAALMLMAFQACRTPEPFDYVDPMIGTGGHGHTFPGATLPFGMVQLSPSNDFKSWDWCSGYHYSDSIIKGFAHTHVSGAGLAGLGDILLMPSFGEVQIKPGTEKNPEEGYRSRFSHKTEKAFPGYYSVFLDDYKVNVELTCTERVGFHKYTFESEGTGNVIIDPTHHIIENVRETQVEFLSDTMLRGYKTSYGEAGNRTVYFVACFSKPFVSYGVATNDKTEESSKKATSPNSKAYVSFHVTKGEAIRVKVALSFTSYEGAMANFEKEARNRNFESVCADAQKIWKEKLNRISLEGGSDDQKKTFYSALYHSFMSPNLISDVDGNYTVEGKKYHANFSQYSNFSSWDTYRALHPLLTLVEQKKTADFVNSLISRHTVSKVELPGWELLGHDNNCMIGYGTVSVIADAALKNIAGINMLDALNAAKAAANNTQKHSPNYDVSGMEDYIPTGFVPAEINCSVSKTTEYNYYDWCIGLMAQRLNNSADAAYYFNRSLGYRNLFNAENNYLYPRLSSGDWRKMDLTGWNDLLGSYISGNIWGYTTYVPHDVDGLINLIGGKDKFNTWLDKIFADTTTLKGQAHVDISGFIGKYGHGDEPSHHLPYLYAYSGQPWKTQKLVKQVLTDFYHPLPDGLINNEDLGQMSAWYIFSSLGFYPVCPGDLKYIIGSPLFSAATLNLENGKSFSVKANGVSARNIYIQSAKLNGKPYDKAFITHDEIMAGGELMLEMGDTPNTSWGTQPANLPVSKTSVSALAQETLVLMPFEDKNTVVFDGQRQIDLKCNTQNALIRYTLDGREPDEKSTLFTKTISISKTTLLKARAFAGSKASKLFVRQYYKGTDRKVSPFTFALSSKVDQFGKQNGEMLFDGLTGTSFFNDGKYTGVRGNNLELIIDLGTKKQISEVSLGYLISSHNWIFPPKYITVLGSDDNQNFKLLGQFVPAEMTAPEAFAYVERSVIKLSSANCRYLKLVAETLPTIPTWHRGTGNLPFMLFDEIIFN
jgi:predicted alpha-1,2-mannosidase